MHSTINLLSSTLFKELKYIDPITVVEKLPILKNFVFLDSSSENSVLGRFSYICLDPFIEIVYKRDCLIVNNHKIKKNLWTYLKELHKSYYLPSNNKCPVDFQGGLVGFLGYELNKTIENLKPCEIDNYGFPDFKFLGFSTVIAFDLIFKKSWIMSIGCSLKNKFDVKLAFSQIKKTESLLKKSNNLKKNNFLIKNLKSNFSKKDYCNNVTKIKNYIKQGDIFQANITQQYTADVIGKLDQINFYKSLREKNPADFSAFIKFDNHVIFSSSPERFISCKNNLIQTRPIKGTIKRNLDNDEVQIQKLLNSEKDKSENTMIVDLMRNDLSKFCEPSSVIVKKLCGVESFATVHHLVSVIEGILSKDKTIIDSLMESFPGGSITGAPKIRAMEIISEIERTTRGPYCGAIGYLGFNGNMDTSIIIRTICFDSLKNKLIFQAGGAVVLDSDPEEEYDESQYKLDAVLTNFI